MSAGLGDDKFRAQPTLHRLCHADNVVPAGP
jgi:hypothetical protein